jgi:uncharacterized protein with PQ loop repeat
MKSYFVLLLAVLLFGKGVAQTTNSVFHGVASAGNNKVIDNSFNIVTNVFAVSKDTLQLQNGLSVQEADNFLNGKVDTGLSYFSSDSWCWLEKRKVITKKGNTLSYYLIENSFFDPASRKKAYVLAVCFCFSIIISSLFFRRFSKRKYMREIAYCFFIAIQGGMYCWYIHSINTEGFNVEWYERYSFITFYLCGAIVFYLTLKLILFIRSKIATEQKKEREENKIEVPKQGVKIYQETKKLAGLTDTPSNKALHDKIHSKVKDKIDGKLTPRSIKLLTQ